MEPLTTKQLQLLIDQTQRRIRLATAGLWLVLAAALVLAVAGAVLSHRAAIRTKPQQSALFRNENA